MINDLKVYMTDRIIKASKVIVIPHNKPDFDAIGSAAGITLIAKKFKKKSRIIVSDDITKIYPGVTVGMGKDHTLYALITGYVKFERKGRDKKQVSVYTER